MNNKKLTLRYDGSRYHGWQRQANAVTVQQKIEEALSKIAKEEVTVIGCSRTDAGVHACEYVCNVHFHTSVPDEKMPYALNALLPEDIAVVSCKEVPGDFHARFDTVGKEYRYLVHNSPHKDPFLRHYAWHYPYALQVDLMQQAALQLVGTYDCSVFEAAGSDLKGSRVRTVHSCRLTREGERLEFTIFANGYLYHMVRIMMGTLLAIGTGKLPPDCIPTLIAGRDRRMAGPTAAPQGLYLSRVFYKEGIS